MNKPNGVGKMVAFGDIRNSVTEINTKEPCYPQNIIKQAKATKRRETWKNIKSFGKYKRDKSILYSKNFERMDYSCLFNNIEFDDYDYFIKFIKGFKSALKKGCWENYIYSNPYPKYEFKEPKVNNYRREYSAPPHLFRVDISEIYGVYDSADMKIFHSEVRIADMVKEILAYDVFPLDVVRCVETDAYFLNIDGRHRFNAYMLLGKRYVSALVTKISSEPLDGFYSSYEIDMIDTYRTLKQETKDKIDMLMVELE